MWNQQKSVRTQGQNKMNYDKYDCPSIFLCKVDCTKKEAGPLMLCWILPDIPPMPHSASQHSGWLFRICRIYDTRSPRVLLALSSILTAFQWCHKTMYREVHSERETRGWMQTLMEISSQLHFNYTLAGLRLVNYGGCKNFSAAFQLFHVATLLSYCPIHLHSPCFIPTPVKFCCIKPVKLSKDTFARIKDDAWCIIFTAAMKH